MNNVNLIGRMTRDPEMRYTASGLAITRFTLAVERLFIDKATGKREADFINCVAWKKTAENIANFCKKGTQVGVTGRIGTSSFEGREGKRVYMTEVVCDNVQFLSTPNNNGQQASEKEKDSTHINPYEKKNPFNAYGNGDGYQQNPFDGQSASVSISDDELPF
jgi:single-strand DNA-binding protein